MRHALSAALLATTMFSMPVTAQAQPMTADEAAALRAEIATLRAKVDSLESRLDTATNNPTPAPAPVAPAVTAKPASEISWKGAPEIKTADGWSFKPRGRILIDAASVSVPAAVNAPGLGFSNELRRVRLGVEGSMPGGFGYKLEADLAGGDVELTDALLTYKHGAFKATVGQHNSFQGLEELTSSNDTSFMERAAFTDAFGFERRVGVSGEYARGDMLVQGGVFTDNFIDLGNADNNSVGVNGRLVFAPKMGDTQLHVGASAHYRDLGTAISTVRYRQRPLVHSTDTRFIATPNIGAESETGYGVEAGFISGRLHGMAEGYWQKVGRPGMPDPTFFGGAVEAGIFLTDDSRSYKGGVFKGVKVKKPVGSDGIGAVQLNLRYDYLDLSDAGIVGGTQNGYMASLIWTPIDYVRFMINYARLDYHDAIIPAGTDRDYGVDSVGMRAQISF